MLMPIPDKQVMLDEVDGLERIAPTDREAILTAGFVAFLQGTPLDPEASAQSLLTAATQIQCLSSPEVEGIMIRKILAILALLDAMLGSGGGILMGEGPPDGVVMGSRNAYIDTQTPGFWFQPSLTDSNTGWIQLS
jgi:hypothetical protein